MNNIIVIDYTSQALLDFIQTSHKKKYEIIETNIHDKCDLLFVSIKANEDIKWEHEDIRGNRYINMSSYEYKSLL